MQLYADATIETDEETAKIYEYALGEDQPIRFPLSGVQVVHNGSRIRISIPRPGQAAFLLDNLIHAEQPKDVARGNKTVYTFAGESERLYMQHIDPAHAQVAFTITDCAGMKRSGAAG